MLVKGSDKAMDYLCGCDDADEMYGYRGDDVLIGMNGDDYIYGGGGNDLISGQGGQDTLTGGAGADRFNFNDISQSTIGHEDVITDFSHCDTIDLLDIQIVPGGSDESFVLVDDFSGEAGQLRVVQVDNKTSRVEADMNGDGVADFAIVVIGVVPDASDFML